MQLQGRTIAVTGASRGIGEALAHRLLAAGADRILAVARDPSRLEPLVAAHAGRVVPFAADLSDPAGVAQLAGALRAAAPDLSVVVNNAGAQLLTDFMTPDADRLADPIEREIHLNFTAAISLTTRLLPHLLAQPQAMVVNVTSGLALAPKQSAPVYCAAKAGLRSFTQALRYQAEARAPHLRIVEALPPLVDTAMTAGRGRGKISAEACAAEIVAGMQAGRDTIYVGKSRLLRAIQGLSPDLALAIMRRG